MAVKIAVIFSIAIALERMFYSIRFPRVHNDYALQSHLSQLKRTRKLPESLAGSDNLARQSNRLLLIPRL
jgi:hypothetical protein